MGPQSTAKAIAFVLTRDRALTKPFYADILGGRLLSEDDFAVVFDLNDINLRLTDVAASRVMQAKGVVSPYTPGLDRMRWASGPSPMVPQG